MTHQSFPEPWMQGEILPPGQLNFEIAGDDEMLGPTPNTRHYFGVGWSALRSVGSSLSEIGRSADSVRHILDLPCGHGRVLRFLRAAFPAAELSACDLNRSGVDFCASTFGAIPIYSVTDPSKIAVPAAKFDLIWVGSLFTHLNSAVWPDYLQMFTSSLAVNGLLVFSAHGETARRFMAEGLNTYGLPPAAHAEMLEQYARTGCSYTDYADYTDYGISLTSKSWVSHQIESCPAIRLVRFAGGEWDSHHDVYACVKEPA